ncbi:hypothetical protein K439DRAFT_1345558 [Ramaria rubella]|nr:hypothetical protein K439DRAFT_1345558 [Ramaria rubella]
MEQITQVIAQFSSSHPGRERFITQFATLLATTPPPCIHIHAPVSPRPTASLVCLVLSAMKIPYASVQGVECFNSRLVFDRVLNTLSGWQIQWTQGCETFGAGKYNGDLDEFIEGLRVIYREKALEKMVLVVERAERFKEKLPELMVPLTRLAELSGLPITIIFVSEVSWFDLRPPYGAAIDPLLLELSNLNKEDMEATLISHFPVRQTPFINPYSPQLKPLYAHYVSTLHAVCSPFLVDEYELVYIAAACWPSFVSPLLTDWRIQVAAAAKKNEDAMDQDPPLLALPSEEARMRLMRYFTPSFAHALQVLYPREQHAAQWSRENAPSPELGLSELLSRGGQKTQHPDAHDRPELTTVAKYVLVAAFLASFNPAKTDVKLVGRAPEERGKKRRGGGSRKSRGRGGGTAKVPQRLLGPAPFPLDRLLAIVGSLMEEHDDNVPALDATHDDDEDEDEQEKDTEMAVGRIQVSATISELVAMRLLYRTTPADRLDGPPSFKCGVSQARAFELARELGIKTLAELMWDPN